MAVFKQLMRHGAKTTTGIIVNLDQIRTILPYDGYTIIEFSEVHRLFVAETLAEIQQGPAIYISPTG